MCTFRKTKEIPANPFNTQVVIETQQWIDGINYPEWGQDQYQIYTVDSEPAVVFAQYDFSILAT